MFFKSQHLEQLVM